VRKFPRERPQISPKERRLFFGQLRWGIYLIFKLSHLENLISGDWAFLLLLAKIPLCEG